MASNETSHLFHWCFFWGFRMVPFLQCSTGVGCPMYIFGPGENRICQGEKMEKAVSLVGWGNQQRNQRRDIPLNTMEINGAMWMLMFFLGAGPPKLLEVSSFFGGQFVERAADLKKGKSIKWVQRLYVSLLWNYFVHDICGDMYNINALCHQHVNFVCISRLARPIHLWRVRISDAVSASK